MHPDTIRNVDSIAVGDAFSDVPPFVADGTNSVVHPNPDLHWHYEDGYAYSHSHPHADRDPITHQHSAGDSRP